MKTAEQLRLEEAREQKIPCKKWGPYLSERQWATVHEDYSYNGDAWNPFTHNQARSRAYRWGEASIIPMVFAELRTVYDGPVVQAQDLTVFNITKEAVVVRQAQVMDQLSPIPGQQRSSFTPALTAPPEWWAEALIPFE